MSRPRIDLATRCPRCRAPHGHCYCHALAPVANATAVSLIVHHIELYRSTSTAVTAHLVLANSRIVPHGLKDAPLDAALLDTNSGTTLYLFPEAGATVLSEAFVRGLARPVRLVVPDGSWTQAQKMRRRNPFLRGLPAVTLPAVGPSRYELRTAPQDGPLCTLEAVAHALGIIEGAPVRDRLLAALDAQVASMKHGRARFRQDKNGTAGNTPAD